MPLMPPIPPMCRSVWWAFAFAGVIALLAAVTAALQGASAPLVVGVWQLAAGTALVIALIRAQIGMALAIPFLGAAVGGVVLGVVGILLPSLDARISLIAIGIWAVLAGAGFLAVVRLAAAQHVVDISLLRIAWATIAAGVIVSTFPAFGLGNEPLAPAVGLAIVGGLTIAASLRLRVMPDEAPADVSNREARRRERADRRP